MGTVNREEIIWAAGFFDGEGHSSFAAYRKKYPSILVDVSQRDRRVLDRFRAAVMDVGKIYGPYKNGMHSYRTSNFKNCQAVIAMLYQFLSPIKKEQCLNALREYHMFKAIRPKRDIFSDTLKADIPEGANKQEIVLIERATQKAKLEHQATRKSKQ